jgi:hypothetical protein
MVQIRFQNLVELERIYALFTASPECSAFRPERRTLSLESRLVVRDSLRATFVFASA